MDFIYKKTGGIFNLHTYWTKQPLEPIEYFIKKYTMENDTVLDPFSGTGMIGVASLRLNRNCILSDISPIARHISSGYTNFLDVDENMNIINTYWENIKSKVQPLYIVKCDNCGQDNNIMFSIIGEEYYKDDNTIINIGAKMFEAIKTNTSFIPPKNITFKSFELLKIVYKCTCSSEKIYKYPSKEDNLVHNSLKYEKLFYPKNNFFGQEPKRNLKKNITKVFELFSKRNLSALSLIYDSIEKIEEENIKQLFLFAFTSILFNCSLMSRYRNYENTSIKMGTYYIPPIIKDNNVLKSFEKKLFNIVKEKAFLINKTNSKVKIFSDKAQNMENIRDESIDFIFTDPPYTDIISYSELNLVWESWLKDITNIKDELIVNKYQNKNIEYFETEFTKFLEESYRVLKKNKYMVIVFHHSEIEHWRHIQKSISNSGFNIIKTELPYRIISANKTASQRNTNKNSQCFLAFTLKKEKKKKELIKIIEKEYVLLLQNLKEKAISLGYNKNSDVFDYIINQLLPEYEILPNISI